MPILLDIEPTKVVIRQWDFGGLVAFFPEQGEGEFIGSYEHMGQHSPACPSLMSSLQVPTKVDIQPMVDELTAVGYNVDLVAAPQYG